MIFAGICVSVMCMPFAVFGASLGLGDVTAAAIVAGIFSVVNTYLNVRMLRQVGAVRQTARAGTEALIHMAVEQGNHVDDIAEHERFEAEEDREEDEGNRG